MKNKNKKNKYIYLIFTTIILYFFLNLLIGSVYIDYAKNLFNENHRVAVKKLLFPYKYISQLEHNIKVVTDDLLMSKAIDQNQQTIINTFNDPNDHLLKKELEYINTTRNLNINFISTEKIERNFSFLKFNSIEGFYSGITSAYTQSLGSGFIEHFNNKLFLMSSRGIFSYTSNLFDKKLMQINSNISNFINYNQFKKDLWFSIKDMKISNNKVYVSITDEFKEDCWNTSLLIADLNFSYLKFKKLFKADSCINSKKNYENEFNGHQAGGKIFALDKNNVAISIGDYRNKYLVQDLKSTNGKIFLININDGKYLTLSIGHRNPEGLYFDDKHEKLYQTEHGPDGGDEINEIDLSADSIKAIQNFGWPYASAGKHYYHTDPNHRDMIQTKYPLPKSHSSGNFIEPLYSFVPSIGISDIVKIKNFIIIGSMNNKSIYVFKLNKNKLNLIKQLYIGERIRDFSFYDNNLYFFMETTASIGVFENFVKTLSALN